MLSLRAVRWLLGYAEFRVLPASPGLAERFFSLSARSGVSFWGIRRRGDCCRARVPVRQYRRLRAPARRAGVRLRAEKRSGLPFLWRRALRRKGLFAGAAVFLALQLILPLFVWSVEVTGCRELEPGAVESACGELGLVPGARRDLLDLDSLRRGLMLRFPQVSWLTLNARGCRVEVALEEKVEPPEMLPKNRYCNLVAARAGQIVSLDVYEGTARVKVGDAVAEGQLLVSGVAEDAFGGARLKRAAGKAVAETRREITVEIPLRETVLIPTGRTAVRRSAELFGVRIPLTLTPVPRGNYRRTARICPFRAGDAPLPGSLLTETWTEVRESTETLSGEQAAKKAEAALEARLEKEWKGVEVTERRESAAVSGGVFRLTARCVCREDVAKEAEILTG